MFPWFEGQIHRKYNLLRTKKKRIILNLELLPFFVITQH